MPALIKQKAKPERKIHRPSDTSHRHVDTFYHLVGEVVKMVNQNPISPTR